MNAFLDVFKNSSRPDCRRSASKARRPGQGRARRLGGRVCDAAADDADLGAVEISQGIGADRKVTLTARTVADLVSQVTSVSNNDMTNSLNAATAVMAPFPTGNLKVVVSSVTIDAQGTATVAWSDTLNGTAKSRGATVTLPAALAIPNSSLIWSEVQYTYKPVIGHVVTGTLTLKDHIYMRPRMSDITWRAPRADRQPSELRLRRSAAPSST